MLECAVGFKQRKSDCHEFHYVKRLLSRSNLPPEVKCTLGASYFEVNRPPLKLLAPSLLSQSSPSERSHVKDS